MAHRTRARAAATFVVAAVALALLGSAQAASGRKPIPNTQPGWLAHAQNLGHAAPGAPVEARLYLAPNGGMAALAQAARAVSTPGSAQYGHFLTPSQYFQRFGTTDQTVAAVSDWLTGAGFHVASVEQHNRYVAITGDVAAAEAAFGVRIDRFRHDGIEVQAPVATLTAPAGVADDVIAVSGLDTTPQTVRPLARGADPAKGPPPGKGGGGGGKPPAPPESGFRNAPPLSAYYGEKLASDQPAFQGSTLPYAVKGYVGADFRSIYEGSTSLDGSGVTVAITDAYASPNIASDASEYASRNGDAPYGANQLTQVLPARFSKENRCGGNGWYGEETLDVEAVHAMAQGANIRYYASASCYDTDFLDTFARINDEAVAQVVTNSWGEVEQAETSSTTAAYEQAFLQGAMEGISYMFSSGDDGDEVASSGTKQTDYPASDPYVTAVGGTATAIGAAHDLLWQTGWGTEKYSLSADGTSWDPVGFLYGSGGGISTVFAQPDYQQGVTPSGGRGVPDVAMDADPTTGMLVGETQTFPDGVYYGEYRIGGTSLASPLFAGMTALAIQQAGHGAGLLNPTIYGNPGAFTDVTGPGADAGNVRVDYVDGVDAAQGTVPSVRTFDQDSSLTVGPGWDDVTGLGTANAGWLTAIH